MADEPTKTPGSITAPADNKDQRISEISNVNRAISNMQKQIDQRMSEIDRDISSADSISSIQMSMNQVLRKLSMTVTDVSKGLTAISWNLAKGSKDALVQIGKAAQDDVKYDPQKMVAMALAKTSPIFGYYASRFVETDVFKNATARMKANIGNALSGVGSKLKSFFVGKEKGTKEAQKGRGLTVTKKSAEKIPKMAKGGVVGKAGLAQLHAAEVVMPVDKLLERMDEQISVSKALATHSIKWQTGALAKMDTYIGEVRAQQKVGLFKGFFKALQEVQSQYEEPSEKRQLRALLAIQSAIGAQIGTWEQVWQKMLIEHPTFRTLLYLEKTFTRVFSMPFKPIGAFFKTRGGYKSHLSKHKQPFMAMNENLGIIYTGSMYRLDAISMYTRATAEAVRHMSTAITGTKYKPIPGVSQGVWSLFGKMRGAMNAIVASTVSLGGRLGSRLIPGAGKERDTKIKGFASQLSKQRLAREVTKMGGLTLGKGRLEKIYGSEQAIVGSMAADDYEKYMPKTMAKFAMQHDAMPVWIKGSIPEEMKEEKETKLWEVQRELTKSEKKKEAKRQAKIAKHQEFIQLEIERRRAKRRKKAEKVANSIARAHLKETKKANRREKMKSIFGFLSGGFGAVKGLLTSAMLWLAPILMGGGGAGGIAGRLIGGIASAIKTAFIGKGGIFRLLLFKIRNVGKLLGGIVTKVFTNPAFLKLMGGALSAALAFYLGWQIGKKIDDWLGITEKFKAKMDEWDKKANELSASVGAKTVEASREARKGGAKGFEGAQTTALQARIPTASKEWINDIGMWGEGNQVAISAAQRKYIQENIQDYMLYTPKQIVKARQDWLRQGGYGAKWMGTDAETYGTKREKAFITWLQRNAKRYPPMSRESLQESFKKYQESRGVTGEYDPYVLDKDLSMIERMQKNYGDKGELAKQEAFKTVAQVKATQDALVDSTEKLIENREQLAKEGKAAVIQQTAIISNSIKNQSSNVMNSAGQMARNLESDYLRYTMKGDVDGD